MGSDLWLVVGLGNPGKQYQGNRHNVGFMIVDALAASERDLSWRSSTRFSAEVAKGSLAGLPTVLVKPQTYMNLSGRAVQPLAAFYDVPASHIVAVHDDVDLEPGRLRVKVGGGDGGHKGIRSMAQELGGSDFARVRCGIGRPEVGAVEDFVLQNFRGAEQEAMAEAIRQAADAVCTLMTQGLREAMNRFNGPRETNEQEPLTPEQRRAAAAERRAAAVVRRQEAEERKRAAAAAAAAGAEAREPRAAEEAGEGEAGEQQRRMNGNRE